MTYLTQRRRALIICCCVAVLLAGCKRHDNEVSYPTLKDAERDGAITRRWIPEYLPASTRNIQEALDLSPSTLWLSFEFDPHDSDVLRSKLQTEADKAPSSLTYVPNPGVRWWPRVLVGTLDATEIKNASLIVYAFTEPWTLAMAGKCVYFVDWQHGRGYLFSGWAPAHTN